MPISIDSIQSLQINLSGVMERANDHAGQVEGVALALLGAEVWRSIGEISIRQNDGNYKPINPSLTISDSRDQLWGHYKDTKNTISAPGLYNAISAG